MVEQRSAAPGRTGRTVVAEASGTSMCRRTKPLPGKSVLVPCMASNTLRPCFPPTSGCVASCSVSLIKDTMHAKSSNFAALNTFRSTFFFAWFFSCAFSLPPDGLAYESIPPYLRRQSSPGSNSAGCLSGPQYGWALLPKRVCLRTVAKGTPAGVGCRTKCHALPRCHRCQRLSSSDGEPTGSEGSFYAAPPTSILTTENNTQTSYGTK